MIAVCLRSVRLEVRTSAAARLAKNEADEHERRELLAAAMWPSARVYFLPDSKRDRLNEVAA